MQLSDARSGGRAHVARDAHAFVQVLQHRLQPRSAPSRVDSHLSTKHRVGFVGFSRSFRSPSSQEESCNGA